MFYHSAMGQLSTMHLLYNCCKPYRYKRRLFEVLWLSSLQLHFMGDLFWNQSIQVLKNIVATLESSGSSDLNIICSKARFCWSIWYYLKNRKYLLVGDVTLASFQTWLLQCNILKAFDMNNKLMQYYCFPVSLFALALYNVDVAWLSNKCWMKCYLIMCWGIYKKGLTCSYLHSFSLCSDWPSCRLCRGLCSGWICAPKMCVRKMCILVFNHTATSPFFFLEILLFSKF